MEVQNKALLHSEAVKPDTGLAAQTLGQLLSQTPEFEIFLKGLKSVNNDLTIQRLAAQMRSHRSALQWGGDDRRQHLDELAKLELEMEELPIVKEYRQAETEVKRLFHAVDEIIRHEAGVNFAENAKRGGCCG
jgi:cell fate (sporulation/competence/biofilm development) regulator YmcA (YheA/YmcA/DUF963 family)